MMLDSGISFGLTKLAGATGNLLLSIFLDHYLKDKYAVSVISIVIVMTVVVLGKTKAELWMIRDAVHGRMERARASDEGGTSACSRWKRA